MKSDDNAHPTDSEHRSIPPTRDIRIERSILWIRGHRVLLDAVIARLYGISTGALMQAVKRNRPRFPSDFLMQLSRKEVENLKSQIVISSSWGGRRSAPFAFTEMGVAMLSSVLRSPRAIQTNIAIMRTFVRTRGWIASDAELARKLESLERKFDAQFRVVFEAIRELMTPEEAPRERIGFHPSSEL